MPLNVPGLLAPLHLLVNPRIVVPGLVIQDIRQLNFPALKKAGYRGAVFDKDNCLTIPYRDTLVPELQEAWKECRETFGEKNVIIVSNSAGTHLDAGGIQAESVCHHLRVPVLMHSSLKPAYSCISSIRGYFRSLPHPIQDHELLVVGDRIFTDVVMANRMHDENWMHALRKLFLRHTEDATAVHKQGPLPVWTTGVWQKESMVMRFLEKSTLDLVLKWTQSNDTSSRVLQERFTHEIPVSPPKKTGLLGGLIERFQTRKS